MPCNPNNPKARDSRYECNPRTNRWVLKKANKEKAALAEKTKTVGRCNPTNPKALDNRYECNPHTNRWVLKKTTTRTTYPSVHDYGLGTVRTKTIKTKTTKTKTTKTKTNKTKATKTKAVAWRQTCKELEKSCPMETDLSGDPWCSLDAKDVFYFKKDNKYFCYGVDEIFSIIHLGFTARDTSYEVPPLRLQLPRDSYDRSPFTAEFMKSFRDHVLRHKQVPTHPEVAYFLKHTDAFYNDSAITQFLTQSNPAKVPLNNAIVNFLMRYLDIDFNLISATWRWRPGKAPRSVINYMSQR